MFVQFRVFLTLLLCRLGAGFEYFLSNDFGDVKKGEFAYHNLSHEGTILAELMSLSGDCDLYVSQKTNKPTYEPESNCLSSSTCGVDSVIIPKSFKRPVGIGVFGHPSHDACSYKLTFYRIDDSRDIFNFDRYTDMLQTEAQKEQLLERSSDPNTSENEEVSLFWVFLKSAFFFLIDVLL